MGFLAAVQFLTVIPVPGWVHLNEKAVKHSAKWFPATGLVVGAVLSVALWLFGMILPQIVAIVLMLIVSAAITGMLHLDGFIDTFDGVLGHRERQKRLAIMRDSRAGSYGIVSAILLIAAKIVMLGAIDVDALLPMVVVMTVTGRWAMVYGIFAHNYARKEGAGKIFKEGMGWQAFAGATFITLAVYGACIPVAGYSAFAAGAAAAVVTAVVALLFSRRLCGLTGDVYGALNEIAEVTVLAAAVLMTNIGLIL